jgi:hypothetical protein
MFDSKNVGRGLSVVAGITMGYLVNKVQEKQQPADILGYTLKTTGSFFLGQYAKDQEQELILRSIISYWSYETMRLTPIGKPTESNSDNPGVRSNPSMGTALVQQAPNILTPDNLQHVGSALKGLSSLLNGFRGN